MSMSNRNLGIANIKVARTNRLLIYTAWLILIVSIMACPSPGLYKGEFAYGRDGFKFIPMSTDQKCQESEVVVKAFDGALKLYIAAFNEAGYIKDKAAFTKEAKNSSSVCMVDQPEPCGYDVIYRGPCKDGSALCKRDLAPRKAGCSTRYSVLISKHWPPICKPDWPTEPHCVKDKTKQTDVWHGILVHEVCNMMVQRINIKLPSGNYYEHPIYNQKDGLCVKVWKQYQQQMQ